MQMDELLSLRLTRQHLLSPTDTGLIASDLCGIQAQTCPTSCTPCASAQAAGGRAHTTLFETVFPEDRRAILRKAEELWPGGIAMDA